MRNPILIAIGVSAFIAFTVTPTFAQNGKDKAPKDGASGHSHFTKIPGTVEEIWKEIKKHQKMLVDVVAKKDLGEAHDHGFAIRDLVRALPGKGPAGSKVKAEEGAKEIATIAGNIDKSSAARAQKATEANVKKMETAIKALEAKLKPAAEKK